MSAGWCLFVTFGGRKRILRFFGTWFSSISCTEQLSRIIIAFTSLRRFKCSSQNTWLIHQTVINDGWDVVDGKGYTNWAIALTATHIAEMVLNDTRSIIPVSTCVRGLYGVEDDVYMSVPSVLTSNGISRIVVLPLTDSEQDIFQKSAKSMWTKQQTVWDSLNTM